MNTENYDQFGRASTTTQTPRFETHTFTLDPSDTGFYVALQDTGTCVGIARLRVYHYNCPSRQVGLVLYPESPAPVSGSVNINIKCVDNAVVLGSPQVTCGSNGTWGPENPVCKCCRGYDEMQGECVLRKLILYTHVLTVHKSYTSVVFRRSRTDTTGDNSYYHCIW